VNTAPIPTDHVEPRRLAVHGRAGVVYIPLTGDSALDAVLRRLAGRGGFVIEERVTDEESAR